MRIYCLGVNEALFSASDIPVSEVRFAFFSALGTWKAKRAPCEACGWHWEYRASPFQVRWEPGSDVIGDFSWDGPYGYAFVVKEEVGAALQKKGFTLDLLPVEYVKPKARRGMKCVPYPYAGPKLWWAECNAFVNLDLQASGVALESSCAECGNVRHTFRYKDIVINRREWHGEKMFRIKTNGRSRATFVSEEGFQEIQQAGFTNVAFSEAGEIR